MAILQILSCCIDLVLILFSFMCLRTFSAVIRDRFLESTFIDKVSSLISMLSLLSLCFIYIAIGVFLNEVVQALRCVSRWRIPNLEISSSQSQSLLRNEITIKLSLLSKRLMNSFLICLVISNCIPWRECLNRRRSNSLLQINRLLLIISSCAIIRLRQQS